MNLWWRKTGDTKEEPTETAIEKEIREDTDGSIRQRELFKEARGKVAEYRSKYPVGSLFSVLGVDFMIKEIYSNYPISGLEVEVLYVNKVTGEITEKGFPVEIVEKYWSGA